jgi:hypothetical protein
MRAEAMKILQKGLQRVVQGVEHLSNKPQCSQKTRKQKQNNFTNTIGLNICDVVKYFLKCDNRGPECLWLMPVILATSS